MKNISLNLRPRTVILGLIVVVLVGVSVYQCLQINGLKRRATKVENRLNTAGYYDEVMQSDARSDDWKELQIQVLSQADKTIQQADYSKEGQDPVRKRVKAIRVKLTNLNDTALDFGGSLSAQLNNTGKMLSPTEPDVGDPSYESTYFTIAPNSETETTLFYELKEGQRIVGLYDTMTQKAYKL